VVVAPGDSRSHGTPLQYFAQQEGKNAIYIQLDDRTYRDARLGTTGGADDVSSNRRVNPNRAMLGTTQLAWAEKALLDAQNAGTPTILEDGVSRQNALNGFGSGIAYTGVAGLQSPLIQDGGTGALYTRIFVYDLTNPNAQPKQFIYQFLLGVGVLGLMVVCRRR